MKRYWGNEEKTKEVIVESSNSSGGGDAGDGERWMLTGDVATIDARGYCRIVGRIKDLIIRGGENISPREIEDALFEHPDVVNVSVIGVPCEKYGEQICAWVQWKRALEQDAEAAQDAELALREFLGPQIARFKIPKYVVFKAEFPMTITGKIQKFKMRETSIKELGLRSFSSASRSCVTFSTLIPPLRRTREGKATCGGSLEQKWDKVP